MAKYQVGIPYTVWVEVEADNEQEAQIKVLDVDYNFEDTNNTPNVTLELQEWNDFIVQET